MKNEPVLVAVTALVVATIALLVAFGVDVTDEQRGAIIGFVVALYGVAVLIRSRVSPVKKRGDRPAVLEGGRRR